MLKATTFALLAARGVNGGSGSELTAGDDEPCAAVGSLRADGESALCALLGPVPDD
ncbi:MAG: hypothetical protein JRI23_10260 [Deltaproteobacteria bacterium]|jgi:hypothetical protein|nr:hypothetical protein [Deltaproteobacteria bacterium]MBW2532051.1 hypothetical protein [Deltaproteobacteria bacterium]